MWTAFTCRRVIYNMPVATDRALLHGLKAGLESVLFNGMDISGGGVYGA